MEKTQNGSNRQVLADLQIYELSFNKKRFSKLKRIARAGYKNFIVRNTKSLSVLLKNQRLFVEFKNLKNLVR